MKIIIIPNMPTMSGRHSNIANHLVDQGHEVHYLLWELPYGVSNKNLFKHLKTSLRKKTYKQGRINVHKVSRLPYFWPYINGILFRHQAKQLYNEINADIIFSEGYTNETNLSKDIPFIYDLADDYAAPADVYGSPIYKLAFKLLAVRKTMK